MRKEKFAIAVKEAKRFLEKSKQLENNWPHYEWAGSKETGAVRRASMDLTRALAELRKSH